MRGMAAAAQFCIGRCLGEWPRELFEASVQHEEELIHPKLIHP
jgi:hypothetical protein